LILQFNDVGDLVNQPDFWQHYLRLALLEIKINKLKMVGNQINQIDFNPKTIDEMLSEIKSNIGGIIDKYRVIQPRDLGKITDEFLRYIDDAVTNKNQRIIKTGYYYESKISGFRPGDFIILAGRPKMGKSAVANAIIIRALRQGKRVMIVNNEMDEKQLECRFYACNYDMLFDSLMNPQKLTEYQLQQMPDLAEDFRKNPLHIYCFSFKTPAQVETEARRLAALGTPIDLLVIDHLGLFMPSQKTIGSYEKTSALSWEFKMLAADLDVPVLALAQLNRKCEDRPNKRPSLSDLRDSGSLEQDASAVMLVYRDEYYNPNTNDLGIAEINVAANRNGTTGVDKYLMDLSKMNLHNLDMRSENA